jgi:GntR family transcriptional repressor for pyruvate dehydrogenase complex
VARTDEVVEAIKDMILGGELGAGDRLPIEKDLADRLGLSRGSLREGVRALTAMGVLDTRQGDGTYVTSLEPDLLLAPLTFVVDLHGGERARHFLSVRRILECEAAACAALLIDEASVNQAHRALDRAEELLAAKKLDREALMDVDREFHRIVSEAAANPVLSALIESISGPTSRARLLRGASQEGALRVTVREHRAILSAVESRDPDRARLRMAVHLIGVEDFLESELPRSSG